MDCSNTSRFLYAEALGIDLPRVASSQYWSLRQAGKAWRTPMKGDTPDEDALRRKLQVGDLLFWEHTYKPRRDPPITHVMVYMGTDEKDRMLMFGSSSGGKGLYSRKRGGPDVYRFYPQAKMGGYSTWLGLGKVRGRFVGYGRPLD